MSQYPSPYTPPPAPMYYAAPPAAPDVLAAGRRAALLMFVLAGLTLFMGTCMLATIISVPAAQLGEQLRKSTVATGQEMPFDVDQMKTIFIVFLALTLVVSIAMIALGVGVRRGGKASTIASVILTGLMIAFLGLQILGGLVKGFQSPAVLASACMFMIPLAIMVLMMTWLIGALRAMSRSGAAQQQYAAQYWQYQQAMQAYAFGQQQGYPAPMNPPQGYATGPSPSPQPDGSNPPSGE